MLGREGEYKRDKQSLQRALHVLTELTEGDPASQVCMCTSNRRVVCMLTATLPSQHYPVISTCQNYQSI